MIGTSLSDIVRELAHQGYKSQAIYDSHGEIVWLDKGSSAMGIVRQQFPGIAVSTSGKEELCVQFIESSSSTLGPLHQLSSQTCRNICSAYLLKDLHLVLAERIQTWTAKVEIEQS